MKLLTAILFSFLISNAALADKQVIVRPGPSSCITACQPSLGTCTQQCF